MIMLSCSAVSSPTVARIPVNDVSKRTPRLFRVDTAQTGGVHNEHCHVTY